MLRQVNPQQASELILWCLVFLAVLLALASFKKLHSWKYPIIATLLALLAGLSGRWFFGQITVGLERELGEWGKLTVNAAGSFGLFLVVFIVVLQWYSSSLKPPDPDPPEITESEKAAEDQKKAKRILFEIEIRIKKFIDQFIGTRYALYRHIIRALLQTEGEYNEGAKGRKRRFLCFPWQARVAISSFVTARNMLLEEQRICTKVALSKATVPVKGQTPLATQVTTATTDAYVAPREANSAKCRVHQKERRPKIFVGDLPVKPNQRAIAIARAIASRHGFSLWALVARRNLRVETAWPKIKIESLRKYLDKVHTCRIMPVGYYATVKVFRPVKVRLNQVKCTYVIVYQKPVKVCPKPKAETLGYSKRNLKNLMASIRELERFTGRYKYRMKRGRLDFSDTCALDKRKRLLLRCGLLIARRRRDANFLFTVRDSGMFASSLPGKRFNRVQGSFEKESSSLYRQGSMGSDGGCLLSKEVPEYKYYYRWSNTLESIPELSMLAVIELGALFALRRKRVRSR